MFPEASDLQKSRFLKEGTGVIAYKYLHDDSVDIMKDR